jgi:hypothetical protein
MNLYRKKVDELNGISPEERQRLQSTPDDELTPDDLRKLGYDLYSLSNTLRVCGFAEGQSQPTRMAAEMLGIEGFEGPDNMHDFVHWFRETFPFASSETIAAFAKCRFGWGSRSTVQRIVNPERRERGNYHRDNFDESRGEEAEKEELEWVWALRNEQDDLERIYATVRGHDRSKKGKTAFIADLYDIGCTFGAICHQVDTWDGKGSRWTVSRHLRRSGRRPLDCGRKDRPKLPKVEL